LQQFLQAAMGHEHFSNVFVKKRRVPNSKHFHYTAKHFFEQGARRKVGVRLAAPPRPFFKHFRLRRPVSAVLQHNAPQIVFEFWSLNIKYLAQTVHREQVHRIVFLCCVAHLIHAHIISARPSAS
jgi:hypothetical protein